MAKKTDMQALKQLAKSLLFFDPVDTEYAPLVIKHPFTDSGIVALPQSDGSLGIGNILENPEDLKAWRKQQAKIIDQAETPFQIAFRITNSYAFGFLKYAQPHLSKDDLSQLLAYMWIHTEAPNSDPNLSKAKLVSMFKAADPTVIMNDEDYLQFKTLDENLTVYRGVTSFNADNIKALSWTLDPDKAFWFAHRFGENGTVYEAQISKEHVYAYFGGRGESEVIVDPKYLTDITQVEEQGEGFVMNLQ